MSLFSFWISLFIVIIGVTNSSFVCLKTDEYNNKKEECDKGLGCMYDSYKNCGEIKDEGTCVTPSYNIYRFVEAAGKIVPVGAKSCCKWVEESFEALRQYMNNNMDYKGNHISDLKDETFIKYEYDNNNDNHKLYILPLDPSKKFNNKNNADYNNLYEFAFGKNDYKIKYDTKFQIGGQLQSRSLTMTGWKYYQTKQTIIDPKQMIKNEQIPRNEYVGNGRVDSRQKIKSTKPKAKPYSRIGLVFTEKADGGYEPCTGTIISDKFILTAAHCIAKNGYFYPVNGIRFYPQFNKEVSNPITRRPQQDNPKNTFRAKAVYALYGFLRLRSSAGEQAANYDMALLEIDDSDGILTQNYGHLGFEAADDTTINGWIQDDNDILITIGYPGDRMHYPNYRKKDFGKPFIMHQGMVLASGKNPKYDNNGRIDDNDAKVDNAEIRDKQFIENKYRSFAGQSGSSIFHWSPDDGYLSIGVVSSGKEEGTQFLWDRFCRITNLRGLLINDIVGGLNDFTDNIIEIDPNNINNAKMIYYQDMYQEQYDNNGVRTVMSDNYLKFVFLFMCISLTGLVSGCILGGCMMFVFDKKTLLL